MECSYCYTIIILLEKSHYNWRRMVLGSLQFGLRRHPQLLEQLRLGKRVLTDSLSGSDSKRGQGLFYIPFIKLST